MNSIKQKGSKMPFVKAVDETWKPHLMGETAFSHTSISWITLRLGLKKRSETS